MARGANRRRSGNAGRRTGKRRQAAAQKGPLMPGRRVGPGLTPGQSIGIVGGGQLGRMLALAAARLGLKTIILDPDPDAPAAQVASRHIAAPFEDRDAIKAMAEACAAVTYEFENVPAETIRSLEERVRVHPSARALAVCQDRLTEKKFLDSLGIPVAAYAEVSQAQDFAATDTGFPAVLKTRRMGYDGKGQERVGSRADFARAWGELNLQPAVIEAFIGFDAEVSVIAARGEDGVCAPFDLTENTHLNHILATSRVPAHFSDKVAIRATEIARAIGESLAYVGVFAVELFVIGEDLIVNEIAPRVHNSGHWTLDAACTSQFEQHIRALAGWPLGSPERHSDAVMTNLIGMAVNEWEELLGEPNAHLHLYGKREAKPHRKMGHVTRTYPLGTLVPPAE
jgi:5-(carboxyamino)imidazole ribonucleotide synthase